MHVVHRGRGRGRRRGRTAHADDLRAALGDPRDELVGVPGPFRSTEVPGERASGVVDEFGDVGELCGGVVAPHCHPVQAGDRRPESLGDLGQGTVVVQPCHRGDGTGRQPAGGRGDGGVGVRRVTDHEDADARVGVGGDGLTLRAEDAAVVGEQFGALRTLAPGLGTDEERRVRPGEGDGGVIGDGDGTEQREGGVLQLHGHTLGGGGGRGDLQEVEVDDGVAAEDLAGGDAEEKGVGDLSGGAGDGHGDR